MIQQGDIIYIDFPFSHFADSKHRPGLVISNDLINHSSDILVMAISSEGNDHMKAIKISGDDIILGRLPIESFVHWYKVQLLEKTLVTKIIGRLKPFTLVSIIKQLNYSLQVKI